MIKVNEERCNIYRVNNKVLQKWNGGYIIWWTYIFSETILRLCRERKPLFRLYVIFPNCWLYFCKQCGLYTPIARESCRTWCVRRVNLYRGFFAKSKIEQSSRNYLFIKSRGRAFRNLPLGDLSCGRRISITTLASRKRMPSVGGKKDEAENKRQLWSSVYSNTDERTYVLQAQRCCRLVFHVDIEYQCPLSPPLPLLLSHSLYSKTLRTEGRARAYQEGSNKLIDSLWARARTRCSRTSRQIQSRLLRGFSRRYRISAGGNWART